MGISLSHRQNTNILMVHVEKTNVFRNENWWGTILIMFEYFLIVNHQKVRWYISSIFLTNYALAFFVHDCKGRYSYHYYFKLINSFLGLFRLLFGLFFFFLFFFFFFLKIGFFLSLPITREI